MAEGVFSSKEGMMCSEKILSDDGVGAFPLLKRNLYSRERMCFMNVNSPGKLAFWAAFFAAVFSVMYSIFQILSALGVLAGYVSQILIFGTSILIAPSFVAMMACVHQAAPDSKKVWSQIGVLFSVLYAVFVMMTYMTELFVVIPHSMRGEADKVALLAFNPESIMYVIDGLGYTFMCLATLFTVPIYIDTGIEKWIKRMSIINGILGIPIFIVYTHFQPVLLFFVALWMVTVPGICILLAVRFGGAAHRENKTNTHHRKIVNIKIS